MKAQLVYFCTGGREALLLDTENLTQAKLEKEYGMKVSAMLPIEDNENTYIVSWMK